MKFTKVNLANRKAPTEIVHKAGKKCSLIHYLNGHCGMFMCSHRVKDLECGKKPSATNSNDSYTNKIALRREHWNLQRKIGFIFHETIHFHSASLFYSL